MALVLPVFEVYPGLSYDKGVISSGCHHFKIEVYETKSEMYEAYKRHKEPAPAQQLIFGAITMPHTIEKFSQGKWYTSPHIGYVLFHKGKIDIEALSHEAVHMALHWCRVKKHSLSLSEDSESMMDHEEVLAYAISDCTKQLHSMLAAFVKL